jgi:raffinose/stachyose/melibiose transport system permease protein
MMSEHRSLYDSPLRGYLYLLPGCFIYCLFLFIPVLQTLQLSFFSWNGLQPKVCVGIKNFITLFSDPIFYRSLVNNLVLVVFIMVLPTLIGLVLASIIELNRYKIRKLFEVVLFMPYILSLVVVGVIWRWIYNPSFGVINTFLRGIGLADMTKAWLGDSATALTAVGISGTWVFHGFAMVIFLAGYSKISHSLYEAISIDGGNTLHKFWYIALPSLNHEISVVTIFLFINSLKTFDLVYVMTKGGPGYATNVISLYVFKNAFQYNRYGYAAALAVTLALIIYGISFGMTTLRRKHSDE